jgi:hypothetical protein
VLKSDTLSTDVCHGYVAMTSDFWRSEMAEFIGLLLRVMVEVEK